MENYLPTRASLSNHPLSDWYNDAKLGIFIHWGLYSVPAFAPTEYGTIHEIVRDHGIEFQFAHNPYAEWYQNSLRINQEPYRSFHRNTFGEKFAYEDFALQFNEAIKKWNPQTTAELIQSAGAKYAVLTTKHHEGFTLWPSKINNPKRSAYCASRNIVKELCDAIRSKGIRFGTYYSGALDWSFQPNPIVDTTSLLANGPISEEYGAYVDSHIKELIDEFKPDLLWNDIGYPPKGRLLDVIAYYFNTIPDGVVNDRWRQIPPMAGYLSKTYILRKIINGVARRVIAKGGVGNSEIPFFSNYSTPEYAPSFKLNARKWECCRGIGRSFGYNRIETAEHYLTNTELIHSFIDIVSKNGNLLLNIGPKADGSIPEIQIERLKTLGSWLKKFGEGIYGSRPWIRAEDRSSKGVQIRYTIKPNMLFIYILSKLTGDEIEIPQIPLKPNAQIELLGYNEKVAFVQDPDKLKIKLPAIDKEECAFGLKITPF